MDYSIEFFKALDGSRLSPENYTDPTWANIGKRMFNHVFGEFVKKQQCKKATRVKRFNCYSGQRWKLSNNKKLENKKGVWKSDDLWIFQPKDDDLIYINNTSKAKVLGATCNTFFSKSQNKAVTLCTVDLEDFEEGKASQLWKKGELDAEDYFILENSKWPKVLTAVSESLEIKGNITMRCIYLHS